MQHQSGRIAPRWLRNSHWFFAALSVVITGYAFVGAWLVTAGAADPVAHAADFLAFLVSRWMLATYVVAGALIAFGIDYLRTSPKRAFNALDIDASMRRQGLRLAIAFVIVAVSLVALGYLYTRDLDSNSRRERASQESSVAQLKAQQVDKWLFDRAIDAELLATSLRGLPLENLPADRNVDQAVRLLFAETLASSTERTSVSLFAPDGKLLIHVGEGSAPDKETVQAASIVSNSPEHRQSIVDLHMDAELRPRMGFAASIARPETSGPTAALAIGIDPFQGLLQKFETWPTPSPTSEVMLVRRAGDDVVFITSPSHMDPVPAPLAFRVPLTDSKLPAAQAILHGDGVWTGPDYRGVEVLTASRHVKRLPWIVLAKTDLEEIVQPLQRKALTLSLVIGAAIMLAALMLIVLWRGEYIGLLAFRDQQSKEHQALTLHYERLVGQARDIVLLIRPDGRIVDGNEAAVAAYGYNADELRALNIRDLLPPEELANFEAVWGAPDTPGGILVEGVNRRKDGTTFPVEVSGHAIDVDGMTYRQASIRDITQRKALESEIARLSRFDRERSK